MDVDLNTAIIGVLIIGMVAMAGWVGFLYVNPITKTKTEEDEETVYVPTYIIEEVDPWGLPEDWSDAPNSTFITIDNGTDVFQVTLGDILDGVALYLEQVEAEEAGLGPINEYKNFIELKHIRDPESESYFTGVDILDILAKYNTNFAFNLSLVSTKTPDGYIRTEYFNTSTGEIMASDYCYEGDDTYMLVLAMNKGWLINSPFGNFSFMHYVPADDNPPTPAVIDDCLLNLEQINVESTWEVRIKINNTIDPDAFESSDFTTYCIIDPSNMTDNEFTANYSYSNNDGGNFNRQYWGRNISEIVAIALANGGYFGQNYTARFWAVDGYGDPVPFGKYTKELIPWNITEIDEGFDPATRGDTVNDPPEPLPRSDLLMCLCYALQKFGEYSTSLDDPEYTGPDPIWPSKKINNYHTGPFKIVVPGRTNDHYLKYAYEIRVTVFPGEIPLGYSDL